MISVATLDRRFYAGISTNWDDTLLRDRAIRLSRDAERILDLGAGAGIVSQLDFRHLGARIHGVDLDTRVGRNPLVQHACVGDAEALPYRDAAFDAVVADNLLEHMMSPDVVFGELARVLRCGGRFHFKTPNRRHYVPLLARLTPHWIHERVAALRGRTGADTFPTRYRANTAPEIRRLAGRAGLHVEELELVEKRPEYCRINAPLYLCGIAYERIVNSSNLFAPFRVIVVGTLRKPTRGGDGLRDVTP